MHLRDALITTEGAILAKGALEFEPDPSGVFTNPPHDHLIIDLFWSLGAKIIPATAVRDPATGYFQARAVGGWLSLPPALDLELRNGLRRLASRPAEVRADHAEGMLASSRDPFRAQDQRLGRCVLTMGQTVEAVEFTVAAELRAAHPFAYWNTSARNHWGEDGAAPRLSARFAVNAATSYVARSAIDVSASPVVERGATPFDGHGGVILERSVVETTGLLLAGSPGGQTWQIFTGLDWPRGDRENDFSIRRTRLDRKENGLFDARADAHWTFRCTAFTLQTVMSLLRRGEKLSLSASGRGAASVETGMRDEIESHDAESIVLTAFAAPSGLTIDIEAAFDRGGTSSPGLTCINFTLPRETLLVRYPRDHSRLYDPA